MRRRQFVSVAAALAATPAIPLTGRPAFGRTEQTGSSSLAGIGELLSGLIPELAGQLGSPGYVAGIYQDGSEWMYAHGVRNLNTGDPMTTDTAWLLGSITKVLTTTLLREHLGLTVRPPFSRTATTLPMNHYAGDYEAFESRLEVRAGKGADELEVTSHFLPSSEEQERVLKLYTGPASEAAPTLTYTAIHDNLFVPSGLPEDYFSGVWGRMALLSFHQVGGNPARRFAHTRFRALLKA